jgi:hypothetical protein
MTIVTAFIIIDEDTVKKAAEYCSDDDTNSFKRIWTLGQQYKEAGMTPMYMLDQMEMQLVVVATETFGKKLN